jgi:predicted nucleic acid-binding protein
MSAAERAFFDTNVLLYLFSDEAAKADRAEALLAGGGVVSVQVLNEFVAVARRKLGLGWDEVEEALSVFRAALDVVPLDLTTHEAGLAVARTTGHAIYDALIIAAAARAGCRTLWTEDMADGQETERLRIANPFAADG